MAIVFTISSILGVVPIALWLMFFLWQDIKKPEPLKWLLILFGVGILITPLVWYGEGLLMKVLKIDLNTNLSLSSVITVYSGIAIIEELTKFFSASLVLKKNKYFDEAIDVMIYLIILALGFGLVENILAASQEINEGNLLLSVLQTMSLRFVGANLLHALSSGIIGYFWALKLMLKKNYFLYEGLILGILLHAVFNIAIIKFGGPAVFFVSLGLFLTAIFLLWAFDSLKTIKKPIKY
ncbi:MAG: PrsW family intramembrane metalloprotease [Parcubacteria group bacterium]|nr:PrsW family intramembrane metalloprotease [Parcubacteria group bacterium]